MSKESVDAKVDAILAQPCPYKIPPLQYLNGHAVCPCICRAMRAAYIEGYLDNARNVSPQVGLPKEDSNG